MALGKLGCDSLRSLDVSMCRAVSDAGVGSVADGCRQLSRLLVWGDTQLTGAFYDGHRRQAQGGAGGSAAAGGDWGIPLAIFGRSGDVMPSVTD